MESETRSGGDALRAWLKAWLPVGVLTGQLCILWLSGFPLEFKVFFTPILVGYCFRDRL